MQKIPDAPWIEETERTGHYRGGWWNEPELDPFELYGLFSPIYSGDDNWIEVIKNDE